MKHEIKEDNTGLLIILEGEFDLYSSVDLRKLLLQRVEEHAIDICLDCTLVDYIDSSGMGLIVQLYTILKKNGHSLTLLNLSNEILNLFRAIKLDKALEGSIIQSPVDG